MATSAINYVNVTHAAEIQRILGEHRGWTELKIKNDPENIPVRSLEKVERGFLLDMDPPNFGESILYFVWNKNHYYLEGTTSAQGSGVHLHPEYLYREQNRKFVRMAIPKGYPAHFDIQSAKGQPLAVRTNLLDAHGDGLMFTVDQTLPVASDDKITGMVLINKFAPVQIAGKVRHCVATDHSVTAGVEIDHLEFASEDKMRELMLFYRHDIFYFNSNKAKS